MQHPSNSSAQREAEQEILSEVGKKYQVNLIPTKMDIGTKQSVEIDGFSNYPLILCEVYSRIGELKSAQMHKVCADILKMLLVERIKKLEYIKILAFADAETIKTLQSDSWLSKAISSFSITIEIVEINQATRKSILDAQQRQKMQNVI